MRRYTALVLLVLATACASQTAPPLELSPGHRVHLLGLNRLRAPDGTRIVLLHYRTERSLADRAAVEQEAEAVWAAFRERAEHADASQVVLRAHVVRRKWLRKVDSSLAFVFVRQPDGSWQRGARP